MGTRRAGKHAGLRERAHAFFQEERVALRALDEMAGQRLKL